MANRRTAGNVTSGGGQQRDAGNVTSGGGQQRATQSAEGNAIGDGGPTTKRAAGPDKGLRRAADKGLRRAAKARAARARARDNSLDRKNGNTF